MEYLASLHPAMQALLAGLFTWGCTAAGAAFVFANREPSRKLLDITLGFAAGVMIAASFWSLLAPAIEYAEEAGTPGWIPAVIGFLLGGGVLRLIDAYLPHLNFAADQMEKEGVETGMRRSTLLFIAITLHNFPEGLAVGVGFGAAATGDPSAMAGAVALAIGIGLQNLPEGMALSVPLRNTGLSRIKSFNYGQLSGIVEPVGAVLGATLVLAMHSILPYALAFAAGAMIFVVAEDLIPDAQTGPHQHYSTAGLMIGFAVMMALDVSLG